MIVSIGIDIIEVARVSEVLARTPRFVERVFTAAERSYCDSRGVVAAQHYAARFAAKEAALKALKTGWRGGLSWQDVEISSEASGAPVLTFYGETKKIFESSGASFAHVSISHTTQHAIAQVILEKR
ncbi:MAG TPA: holo-ACP synthase [Pyrinomonadaceae bacterium]|nr:holo-ACP synthase [Pyrinomonadaceae bacterium]